MEKQLIEKFGVGASIVILATFAVTAFAQVSDEVTTTQDVVEEETVSAKVTEEAVIEETASSTEEVVLTETEAPQAPIVEDAVSEEGAKAPEPVVEEEKVEPVPVVNIKEVRDIATLQDSYFEKTGSYLQILPGNQLPEYEDGSVSQKLGGTLPSDAYVHVYESPKGKGYQIFFKDGNTLISTGFGPEAADRTFTKELTPVLSATSSEAI